MLALGKAKELADKLKARSILKGNTFRFIESKLLPSFIDKPIVLTRNYPSEYYLIKTTVVVEGGYGGIRKIYNAAPYEVLEHFMDEADELIKEADALGVASMENIKNSFK